MKTDQSLSDAHGAMVAKVMYCHAGTRMVFEACGLPNAKVSYNDVRLSVSDIDGHPMSADLQQIVVKAKWSGCLEILLSRD
jgi:hypothetical protein